MVDDQQGNNPYILGDPGRDIERLQTQTGLFASYVRANARRLVRAQVGSILDLGCGGGQLGLMLKEVYPDARLVGIDRDPKAIEDARSRAVQAGVEAEYVVGDIQQALPDGPFDLVYASLVMVHTQQPEQVVQHVAGVLSSGGHLWVKDLDSETLKASRQAAFSKLSAMMFQTLQTIKAHPYIANELPGVVEAAGLSIVQRENEVYGMGGADRDSQTMLAAILGGFYNAREAVARFAGVPVAEQEQLYSEVIAAVKASDEPIGEMHFVNMIARKGE